MRHYNCSFTVACIAHLTLLRPPTRAYTAIPLNKAFLRRGALPHISGEQTAAHLGTTQAPTEVSLATSAVSAGGSPTDTTLSSNNAQLTHLQGQPYHFLQSRTTPCAPAPVYESPQPASRMACVRVPRLLVFGGDVVSVTALEALHARMRCIVREALRCSRHSSSGSSSSTLLSHLERGNGEKAGLSTADEDSAVESFVREHITVVCPALPKGMTPEDAAKKFTRQYPVVRYCVDQGLPIIPVDHPKSLAQSTLLKEMLSTVQTVRAKRGRSDSTGQSTAAASSVPSETNRSKKTTSLTSHLPSHVFSAAQLVRNRTFISTAECGQKEKLEVSGTTSMPGDENCKTEPLQHTWAAHGRTLEDYDLAVVVSFRYFLPQHLLRALPPVINMHPSLLPRYRGASPIFSALRHNEAVGGVSIIQMKPEQKAMDSGSILWQCEVPMTPDMDIRLYFPLVTQIGAAGLCDLIFGEAPAASRPVAASTATAAFDSMHRNTVVTTSAMTTAATHQWLTTHGVKGRNVGTTCLIEASSESQTLSALHEDSNGLNDVSHAIKKNAQSLRSSGDSTLIPPWVALRRSTLMPVVHRCSGHTSLPSPPQDKERLAPYMDRSELTIISSIITAYARESGKFPDTHEDHNNIYGSCMGGEAASSSEVTTCRTAPLNENHIVECSAARQRRQWMTLCRSPTLITPEAVNEASKAHRALFFQNLESASAASGAVLNGHKCKNTPHNKKQVCPAAAAGLEISTSMKCAEVFPKSVLSSHCDWPDSFTYSWKFAQLQEYRTFAHFTDDPFHAPLLPKDAAVLRFSAFTAMEAFGVWRAFVGGDYFQPSINATLDKGNSPVRNQLVHRGLRRLLRERAKAQRKSSQLPQQQQHEKTHSAAAVAVPAPTTVATREDSETPVGIVVGKHVDLDVFNPTGLQLLVEAENTLRTPCAFTQVTNPTLVPQCVRDELAEVERGGDRCCGWRPSAPLSGRRVRFYRAPPAIFRSLLSSRADGNQAGAQEEAGEEVQAESTRGQQMKKAATKRKLPDGREGCTPDGDAPKSKEVAEGVEVRQKKQQPGQHRDRKCATKQQQQRPDEPAEDEEAPEDYVPDIIHAAPPTEHRWHIPTGTGYFPESDESYGAIKCKDGWFLWKEAHMKWSNKAQPAVLIRKGLAMKTGVLYVGLFSEYS